MSFSFDPNLTRALDQTRALLNDTTVTRYKWGDELLNLFLTGAGGNPSAAAAAALRQLAVVYSFQVDVAIGDKRVSGSQFAKQLRDAASEIESGGGLFVSSTAVPWAAGLSRSEDAAFWSDLDIPAPVFGVVGDDHDHPRGTRGWGTQGW